MSNNFAARTLGGTRAALKAAHGEIDRLRTENAELKEQVSRLNSYGSAEIRRLTKERDEAREKATLLGMQ